MYFFIAPLGKLEIYEKYSSKQIFVEIFFI